MAKPTEIIAFTDGACLGNPGPGGWGYVIVFPSGEVRELAGFEANTTNNQMELRAALECAKAIKTEKGNATVFLDSQYVIQGISKSQVPVKNSALWKSLFEVLGPYQKRVQFKKVPGHEGIPGNERADQLASAMAMRKDPDLFRGNLEDYRYPVLEGLDFSINSESVPFYVSLVDGHAETHHTWAECETAVKGKKGAKFKKVFSKSEAERLIKEWNKP